MRVTLWTLLRVMVFKEILLKKLIIRAIMSYKIWDSQEFGLNQECKTEPAILKSQVFDCKVTTL